MSTHPTITSIYPRAASERSYEPTDPSPPDTPPFWDSWLSIRKELGGELTQPHDGIEYDFMDEKMDLKGFNIDSTNEISSFYNHIVWCNHVGFDGFFPQIKWWFTKHTSGCFPNKMSYIWVPFFFGDLIIDQLEATFQEVGVA